MSPDSTSFSLLIAISFCFLQIPVSSESQCLTTRSSSKSNTPCVFPFGYKGTSYDGCTDASDPDNKLWCSTKVDGKGNHIAGKGEWGYCPTPLGSCPDARNARDDVGVRSIGAMQQRDKTCDAAETCQTRQACSYIENKMKLKNSFEKRTPQRNELIKELKSLICNKKQKALCCPPCSSEQTCISKENCPEVKSMIEQLKRTLQKNSAPYKNLLSDVQLRICHRKKKLFCCPSSIKEPEDIDTEPPLPEDSGTYIPHLGKCGINPEAPPSKVLGGSTSTPGEFPFTALIGYRDTCFKRVRRRRRNKKVPCIKFKCGGTLINRRYVLTAAHCHKPATNLRIAEVVLGEWSVKQDPDCRCKDVPGKQEPQCFECQPPIQKFDIGEDDVTIHEEYIGKSNSWANDIALIRLNRPAELNRGSQIVCLPVVESIAAQALNIGTNLAEGLVHAKPTVVGWGYTSYDPFDLNCQGDLCPSGNGNAVGVVASDKQQKLVVPILSREQCEEAFTKFSPGEGQLCAGGVVGEDSCKGDSGSGLYLSGGRVGSPWYQVGLVSFGAVHCGGGKPAVYTRVSHYVAWIRRNLRP